MSTVRKPLVAGTFYDDNSKKLQRQINEYLDNAVLSLDTPQDILGVISPHAGYIYSGQCAAYSYNALQQKDFDLAVIIAPSHQYGDFYFSVGNYDSYETPLGKVKVATEIVEELLTDSKFIFYPYAHNNEHSLEVQLPFLQTIKPKAKILPILIGYQYDKSSEYLSNKITSLLTDKLQKTVIIVSSDLSHYHNSDMAEQLDKTLLKAVEELNIEFLWDAIKNKKTEACGFGGILTIMNMARSLHYEKVKSLSYTNSGMTGGNYDQVVGYLASVFYK